MNRELKFRAWNPNPRLTAEYMAWCKERELYLGGSKDVIETQVKRYEEETGKSHVTEGGEMMPDATDLFHDNWTNPFTDDVYPVMQFTGMQDKNGTDIYEGDLIRLFDNDNGYFEVKFLNAYEGGWILKNSKFDNHVSLGARKAPEVEVIGNIYQNNK